METGNSIGEVRLDTVSLLVVIFLQAFVPAVEDLVDGGPGGTMGSERG